MTIVLYALISGVLIFASLVIPSLCSLRVIFHVHKIVRKEQRGGGEPGNEAKFLPFSCLTWQDVSTVHSNTCTYIRSCQLFSVLASNNCYCPPANDIFNSNVVLDCVNFFAEVAQ